MIVYLCLLYSLCFGRSGDLWFWAIFDLKFLLRHDGSFWTLNMMGKIINSSSSSSHSFIPWHKIKVGGATKTFLFPAFSLTSWYSHVYGCQRRKKLVSEDVICLEVLNLLITMQTRGFGPPRETQEKSRVVSNLTKNLKFCLNGLLVGSFCSFVGGLISLSSLIKETA